MKKLYKELRLFFKTILLGMMLAVVFGTFGFLDHKVATIEINLETELERIKRLRASRNIDSGEARYSGEVRYSGDIDDNKLLITILLPYLGVLVFRIVDSIKRQDADNNKE